MIASMNSFHWFFFLFFFFRGNFGNLGFYFDLPEIIPANLEGDFRFNKTGTYEALKGLYVLFVNFTSLLLAKKYLWTFVM